MADTENTNIQAPPSAPGGKNPLLTILVLLNTITVGVIGYFQFTLHQKQASEPSVKDVIAAEMKKVQGSTGTLEGEAQADDGILFPLEDFTANLAQGDGPRRYLRLSAVLKFSKDSREEEFKARKPQIRDVIISTLNSKRPEDLLKVEGKNFLKEEIKAAVNAFLVDGHVSDVYYVSFQIN
jgi:flagellar FliL protein